MIRVINFVDFSTARHSSNEFGSVQALNEKFVVVINIFVRLVRLVVEIKKGYLWLNKYNCGG